MKRHRATITYERYQRLFRLNWDRERAQILAAFPETGGLSLFMHNWFRCGEDPVMRDLAEQIFQQCADTSRRLNRRFRREYWRAIHNGDHQGSFRPRCCHYCTEGGTHGTHGTQEGAR